MRMQDSAANCGPYALKNALCALGIERSAEELEKLCKTSATKGTSPQNLFRAAEKIEGCYPAVLREKRGYVALLSLEHTVGKGRPALLVVDEGQHWVAVVGRLGERFLVADSADNELVISYDASTLLDRWADTSFEAVML